MEDALDPQRSVVLVMVPKVQSLFLCRSLKRMDSFNHSPGFYIESIPSVLTMAELLVPLNVICLSKNCKIQHW